MKYSFIHQTEALTLCIYLFFGMIIFFILGRFANKIFYPKKNDDKEGAGPLSAALFALFGFILAFTFSMSGTRYESVRNIFVDESNNIGTAILRADLYPDSVRDAFRADFKEYLEARISLYSDLSDTALSNQSKQRGVAAAASLWKRAIQQSKLPNTFIPSGQMVPALNAMFDIGTKRETLLRTAVPDLIIYMLFILAMVSSFVAGLVINTAVRLREWIVIICYFLFAAFVIYITLDLGRPLRGLIRVQNSEQTILDLRQMFK
ncbi:MAG TPA: hypothetical protein VMI12_12240 [Puia sp.]|nr:hypothetical protein [Puia sp.]